MKSNLDKWLVLSSDEYYSHILFEDISAFQRNKNKNEIRIFLKGNYLPLVFGFASPEALDAAMDVMIKNLSPIVEPTNKHGRLVDANEIMEQLETYGFQAPPDMMVREFVEDCLEPIIEAEE